MLGTPYATLSWIQSQIGGDALGSARRLAEHLPGRVHERVRLAQAARQQPVQELGREVLDAVLDVALAGHRLGQPRDGDRRVVGEQRALGAEVEAPADVAVEIREARGRRLRLPALGEDRALERGVRLDEDDRVRPSSSARYSMRQPTRSSIRSDRSSVRATSLIRSPAQKKKASASTERLRRHRPTSPRKRRATARVPRKRQRQRRRELRRPQSLFPHRSVRGVPATAHARRRRSRPPSGSRMNGADGDRTRDLRAASAALSQLSYGPAGAESTRVRARSGQTTWRWGTWPQSCSRR